MSHLELWNNLILDQKYDYYLIIEDDIQMKENIRLGLHFIYEQLQESKLDWDILYLGFSCHKKNQGSLQEKLARIRSSQIVPYDLTLTMGGTFGYIMNKSGASKLIHFIKENGIKHGIDYLMFHYADRMNLKHYQILPSLITSEYAEVNGQVDSDIQYDLTKLF